MAVPNPPTPYDGLYVYDVYDAVQGGDPSIPNNPFNLNGDIVAYGEPPVITSYLTCAFPSGQNNKIIRYTLTRKNDGNNLVGLTKLATLGNYGGGGGNDSVKQNKLISNSTSSLSNNHPNHHNNNNVIGIPFRGDIHI
jgi:hypothetical protein